MGYGRLLSYVNKVLADSYDVLTSTSYKRTPQAMIVYCTNANCIWHDDESEREPPKNPLQFNIPTESLEKEQERQLHGPQAGILDEIRPQDSA